MKNRLLKIKQNGDLCEIYSDFNATSKYAVGYILDFDGDYTVIKLYDPYGHYDGIAYFLTDSIYDVQTNTLYLKSLKKLIAHYDENSTYGVNSICDMNKMLSLIKREKRICEIELCESHNVDNVGIVTAFNDDVIEILNIDKYGKEDGEATVSRQSVSQLSFDSTDTIKVEILYGKN